MSTVDRLLRQFAVGDRVRAICDIHYITEDFMVAEGTMGTATGMLMVGLALIVWDGSKAAVQTCTGLVDPVLS